MSDYVSASAQGVPFNFELDMDLDDLIATALLDLGSSEAGQSG